LLHRGQTVLANRSNLFSLRADVEGANTAAALAKSLGESLRPIPLGPDLLGPFSDSSKRRCFFWSRSLYSWYVYSPEDARSKTHLVEKIDQQQI